MVDILGGMSAITKALDMLKTLNDVENKIQVQAAIKPLYDSIIEAQKSQLELIAKADKLEKLLAEADDWKAEASRYELEQLPPGVLVYKIKREHLNGEPEHRICATCFQKKKKSLLNNLGTHMGLTHWRCFECGLDVETGHFIAPPIEDYDPYNR